jgi:quercetin dioxygenase-like cupin family protein
MEKPNQIDHPWGKEIVWGNQLEYSGRVFVIKEGDSQPFGYHKQRDKTIFILQGIVQLRLERQTKLLQEGETYHLSSRIIHQLCAVKGDATILECGTRLINDFVEVKI